MIPNGPSLGFLGAAAFTVEAWVNIDQPGPQQVMNVIRKGANYELRVTGPIVVPQNSVKWTVGLGSCNAPAGAFVYGQWNHIAASRAGNFLAIYINGQQVSTCVVTEQILSGGDVVLGGTGLAQFRGRMDEVKIWSKALTPQELADSASCLVAGTEPDLVGYWKFDETFTDQVVLDSSPQGNHGVLGYDASPSESDPDRIAAEICP